MQPVVKNLLIINLLFFLATVLFQNQDINLIAELGLFYPDSFFFKPYQLATHFFMHGSLGHIFFNMFALVVFGNNLERIWGAKRFLLFYFVTALGAAFLHMLVQGIEVYNIAGTFFPVSDKVSLPLADLQNVVNIINSPVVGASGAVYGLIAATALLFPNTTVYLYFAIPIKMKWLALGLGALALFSAIQENPGDSVAHFAHLGGMLFGFILIRIWQKDKSQFY